MTLEEDILIEKFIKGLLDKKEKELFIEKMKTDDSFRKKVSLEEELINRLNEKSWHFIKNTNSDELKDIELFFKDKTNDNIKESISRASKNYHSKKNKKRFVFYFAASIALLVSLFYYNLSSGSSPYELYENYIDRENIPSLIDRNDNNPLSKAETLFNEKKYKEASIIFSKAINSKPTNSSIYLYLAISQIELQQYTLAEQTLNKLINSNLIDSEKGYWYKSLLFLKLNSIEQSKELLNLIVKNNYFNHNKAKILLNQLNKE